MKLKFKEMFKRSTNKIKEMFKRSANTINRLIENISVCCYDYNITRRLIILVGIVVVISLGLIFIKEVLLK